MKKLDIVGYVEDSWRFNAKYWKEEIVLNLALCGGALAISAIANKVQQKKHEKETTEYWNDVFEEKI